MTITINCLIVDDEPLAIQVIENYLKRLSNVTYKACRNAIEAVQLLQQEKFDIIFLDIEMPVFTGIDFIKNLKQPPIIIITTAYTNYAVEGFELEVLDYLVKPISFPRFMKAFDRALKLVTEANKTRADPTAANNQHIFIKVDRKYVKVLVQDILYIESLRDYIKIYTTQTNYITYQTLTSVTENLPPDKFIRVHRSYTIAIDKVTAAHSTTVQIKDTTIPIAREHRQQTLNRLLHLNNK